MKSNPTINVPIESIKPYGKNAKKHPKKQVEQIAASIKAFGFNQPIVVDTNNVIIVGHGRLEAAKHLELKEVPVVMIDIGEMEARAYRLADNKLNESDWDMELVIEELKDLTRGLLELTGFNADLIIEDDDKDDVVPSLPSSASTKLGDIYLLGNHRLVCGDATKHEDVAVLMKGTLADMVFTDPPYNVNYKGQGKETSEGIMNDSMTPAAFDIFLNAVFASYVNNIKGGAPLYVFHSTSTQTQFQDAMEANGLAIRTQLIWNKPMAALGWGDYRWKHEPFFYAGVKDEKIQFYGDRTHSSIWDFQDSEAALTNWVKKEKRLEKMGKTSVWSMKRDPVQNYVHPTQKPVELICYALTNSSKAGDIVLDFFGGSGSTLIASEKMGRTCYTLELDPKYCDVIVQRYVDYVRSPNIVKNGQPSEWQLTNEHEREQPTTSEPTGDSDQSTFTNEVLGEFPKQ